MDIINKLKSFYYDIKDLRAISIATAINNGIGAIFWLVIASILGTEQYGQISYLLALAIIASRLSLLGAANTLMVYIPKKVKIQPVIFISVIISSIVSSLIVYFIFLGDLGVSVYIFGFAFFSLATYDVLGKKDYGVYLKYIILQKILLVVFSLLMFYIRGSDGVILGIGLSFVPFIVLIFREIKKEKIDFNLLKQRKKFIINNYFLDIINVFNGTFDKLIILPIFGFVLLGNYQLAQQFFSLLIIIPAMVYHYILPHDSSGTSNKKLKKKLIIFSIASTILVIFLAPILLPIFFKDFVESVDLIQIMSIAIIPSTISIVYTSKFLGIEKINIVLISSGIFLLIQTILLIILANTIGIIGTAISLVIASSSQALFLVVYEKFIKNMK